MGCLYTAEKGAANRVQSACATWTGSKARGSSDETAHEMQCEESDTSLCTFSGCNKLIALVSKQQHTDDLREQPGQAQSQLFTEQMPLMNCNIHLAFFDYHSLYCDAK